MIVVITKGRAAGSIGEIRGTIESKLAHLGENASAMVFFPNYKEWKYILNVRVRLLRPANAIELACFEAELGES